MVDYFALLRVRGHNYSCLTLFLIGSLYRFLSPSFKQCFSHSSSGRWSCSRTASSAARVQPCMSHAGAVPTLSLPYIYTHYHMVPWPLIPSQLAFGVLRCGWVVIIALTHMMCIQKLNMWDGPENTHMLRKCHKAMKRRLGGRDADVPGTTGRQDDATAAWAVGGREVSRGQAWK